MECSNFCADVEFHHVENCLNFVKNWLTFLNYETFWELKFKFYKIATERKVK